MAASLIVSEGVHKDREIPLPDTIFLIGRDAQCHIRPHCQSVSMLHCAIVAWAGKVRVRDFKSRNGTFINGQPIHGEVAVQDGDELKVGTLTFTIRVKNEDGAPSASKGEQLRDLQWLLDSPADSSVISPSKATIVVAPPSEADDGTNTHSANAKQGAAGKTPGSKSVSAGKHLRTYVENKKRRPRGPAKS